MKKYIIFILILLLIPNLALAYNYGGNANSGYHSGVVTVPQGKSAWYTATWGMRLTLVKEDGYRLEGTNTIDIVNTKNNISGVYHNASVPYKYLYVHGAGASFTQNLTKVYTAKEKNLKSVPNFLNSQDSTLVYSYFATQTEAQWLNLASVLGLTAEKFNNYIYESGYTPG